MTQSGPAIFSKNGFEMLQFFKITDNWVVDLSRGLAKRISLGVLAMLITALIMDALPNPYGAYGSQERFIYFSLWPAIWGGIEIGIAALAGAYVAKIRFVIPAIFFTVTATVLAVVYLRIIAEPIEPQSTGEIVGRNSINFIVALGGAIIGATVGAWLANRRQLPKADAV